MAQALPGMTWRRFMVLVTGLGPNSAWVTLHTHRKQPTLITDQDAAEKHMESLLG